MKPILFNAPMVRAILEGRKSQTRREKKFAKPFDHASAWPFVSKYPDGGWVWTDFPPSQKDLEILRANGNGCRCPYGDVGDQLWVRETWGIPYTYVDEPEVHKCDVIYRANPRDESSPIAWHPSIHMPRCFSRITLKITQVRVERLQDISEQDAKAEGVLPEFEIDIGTFVHNQKWNPEAASTYRLGYKHLWNEINGNGSWDKNPWVWVIELKRL